MSEGATVSHVLLLDLVDDAELIAAYREWHRPGGPPSAVTRQILASGIVAMTIWQTGDRLVMLMETTPDFDPVAKAERDGHDADVQAWERMMDKFQKRLPFAPPDVKWVPANRIYDLATQTPADEPTFRNRPVSPTHRVIGATE
ncbi:L-rhamnose mutarotase [Sphingomonas hengshuiensis]|uniref:L-rhamnose mutarotase n=1 Tax=Sphingomonas hengshuiensis TaxID=1609977 RepID=UPI000981B472|nr:L-rhamnose mutarotase [Sphingomonas hengshuiensis]